MADMHRRKWFVVHGRDGFALMVRDCWIPGLLVERATEAFLAAVGHPCCGKGLGRIRVDALDVLWWTVMNLPCKLSHHDVPVASLPLTVEQAYTLKPSWRDESWITLNGTDDCGYTWVDGVMVGTPGDD